jgi:hypothetical protein
MTSRWRRGLEEKLGEREDSTDLVWRKHQAESGASGVPSPDDWWPSAFPDVSLTGDQAAEARDRVAELRPVLSRPAIAGWDLMSAAERDAYAASWRPPSDVAMTDEELAARQAAAAAASPKIDASEARRQSAGRNWSGAGDGLPDSARAAAGLRLRRVRVHEGNIPASIDRETDGPELYRRVIALSTPHRKGDPWQATLLRFAWVLTEVERRDKTGFARRAVWVLAKMCGLCSRTIHRCALWFEAHGLADVEGTMVWQSATELRNAPNIYVLTVDLAPAPAPADVEATAAVLPPPARSLWGKFRVAALFGLVVGHGWLNKPAARSARTNPAPA